MVFEKIEAPSMTDLFIKSIEEKILTGELKAGDRLPTERSLSESMGVSLAVVHNGLKQLGSMGFVRIAPRQGTFVDDYVRRGGVDTLNVLIEYAGTGYDMSIIRQFGDLRKLLEIKFYEDACINCSEEDIGRLKDIHDRYFDSESPRDRASLYFDFVHEVAVSSGNIVSPMLLMTFRDLYINFCLGLSRLEETAVMDAGIKDLYVMIEQRDREHIGAEVEKKIDQWLDSYSKHYSTAI